MTILNRDLLTILNDDDNIYLKFAKSDIYINVNSKEIFNLNDNYQETLRIAAHITRNNNVIRKGLLTSLDVLKQKIVNTYHLEYNPHKLDYYEGDNVYDTDDNTSFIVYDNNIFLPMEFMYDDIFHQIQYKRINSFSDGIVVNPILRNDNSIVASQTYERSKYECQFYKEHPSYYNDKYTIQEFSKVKNEEIIQYDKTHSLPKQKNNTINYTR